MCVIDIRNIDKVGDVEDVCDIVDVDDVLSGNDDDFDDVGYDDKNYDFYIYGTNDDQGGGDGDLGEAGG